MLPSSLIKGFSSLHHFDSIFSPLPFGGMSLSILSLFSHGMKGFRFSSIESPTLSMSPPTHLSPPFWGHELSASFIRGFTLFSHDLFSLSRVCLFPMIENAVLGHSIIMMSFINDVPPPFQFTLLSSPIPLGALLLYNYTGWSHDRIPIIIQDGVMLAFL